MKCCDVIWPLCKLTIFVSSPDAQLVTDCGQWRQETYWQAHGQNLAAQPVQLHTTRQLAPRTSQSGLWKLFRGEIHLGPLGSLAERHPLPSEPSAWMTQSACPGHHPGTSVAWPIAGTWELLTEADRHHSCSYVTTMHVLLFYSDFFQIEAETLLQNSRLGCCRSFPLLKSNHPDSCLQQEVTLAPGPSATITHTTISTPEEEEGSGISQPVYAQLMNCGRGRRVIQDQPGRSTTKANSMSKKGWSKICTWPSIFKATTSSLSTHMGMYGIGIKKARPTC